MREGKSLEKSRLKIPKRYWCGGGLEDTQSFNTPGWYVCILMICYIFFFLFEKNIEQNLKKYVYLLWGLAGMWIVHKQPFLGVPLLNVENGRGYLSFAVGCIMGKIYLEGCFELYKKRIRNVLLIIFGLLAVLVYFFSPAVLGDEAVMMACVISPMIILFCIFSKYLKRILESRAMQILGKESFAIYLWHCPIFLAFNILNLILNNRLKFDRVGIYVWICLSTIIVSIVFTKIYNRILKLYFNKFFST